MAEPVGLYITFWAAPGKIDALVEALEPVLAEAAREPGTLAYGFHRVSGTLEGVSVYEIYADAEAQALHGRSDAIEALKAKLPDLLGAPPERHALTPIASTKGLPF
jgi:quinol monooxygenase YgiN